VPPAGAVLSLRNWFCCLGRQAALFVKRKVRRGSDSHADRVAPHENGLRKW
jgi:hypothetical protein